MNIEELQRLIDEETVPYELNPEWEVVTNVKVVAAARLVANPNLREQFYLILVDYVQNIDDRNVWDVVDSLQAALTPGTTK